MDRMSIDFDASGFIKGLDELNEIITKHILGGLFLAGESLREDSVMIVPFDKGFSGGL